MTRHQIHLKNIRKMGELGYELVSDPILMRRMFGTQKTCICPPCKAQLHAEYGGQTFGMRFQHGNDQHGNELLYFSSWKKLGNWIHDYYEIEMLKRVASGELNSEQTS